MTKRLIRYSFILLISILELSFSSNAQISAPGRDWSDTTKYSKVGIQQDSIFVFFSSAASPKKGTLKAKFSDGSSTNFHWYKYDQTKPVASRFVSLAVENGVTESNLTNLDKGGYKVIMTRVSDLAVDSSSCWVMIDSVKITSLSIDSRCGFLEITANPLPTRLSILNYSVFSYWDFKSSNTYHRIIDELSRNYFNDIVWHASNSEISIPSSPSLILTIGPAPYYDSKYNIVVTNPFGRVINLETPSVPAIATKADFTMYVDKDNNNSWTEGDNGEAPLKLKFDTKSINADSIYWQIINDPQLFKQGGDSILWREGYLTANGIDIIPTKKLLPGTFNVEHISVNVASGCRDTMVVAVKVDSSFIKPENIPNVFSPNNGDGLNNTFVFKDKTNTTKSIKTFKISIFSRQGMLVYSYTGSPKDWNGWDGKMDGSKRDTPEGIYYFIIEAVGWDGKTFKRGPYKGFLYLYRGK